MATNHTCVMCGKKYYYCPVCQQKYGGEPWMATCCSAECFQAKTILSAYNVGNISQEEAFDAFVNLDYDADKLVAPLYHSIALKVLGETTEPSIEE